jgi:methylmalonyl-CoA mutase
MMPAERLLDEFPAVTTADWEAAIARDLKGADYKKKLVWQTEEGLSGNPYFQAADLNGLAILHEVPGEFPFSRGARASGDWTIREEIDALEPAAANQAALEAVAAGAEGIAFTGAAPTSLAELDTLTAHLDDIPLHFQCSCESVLRLVIERLGIRHPGASISTGFNPLADLNLAAELSRSATDSFVPFTFDSVVFEESGATTSEEIAFTLALGVDFLAAMQDRGANLSKSRNSVRFARSGPVRQQASLSLEPSLMRPLPCARLDGTKPFTTRT